MATMWVKSFLNLYLSIFTIKFQNYNIISNIQHHDSIQILIEQAQAVLISNITMENDSSISQAIAG